MKRIPAVTLTVASLLLASCIKPEEENMECDIESVSVHLDTPSAFFYHDYDTLQIVNYQTTDIVFTARSYADVGSLPLTLSVSAGAVAYLREDGAETPFRNGSLVDFSGGAVRHFRVVSQDKAWSRDYKVSVVCDTPSDGNLTVDFSDYALDASGKYYVWNAPSVFTGGTWKNGNPGFKISRSSATPMEYPSTPAIGAGPDGSDCLKLETCDTGTFGRMAKMLIASGSMFNGDFDVQHALTNALKATQFGSPFTHKPMQMRVWLRYEPGSRFQDKSGAAMSGIVDEPDAYVVLYRNEDASGNPIRLDGSNVLSSPHIVGLGRLPHHYNPDGSDLMSGNPIHGVTDQWQEFIIPVQYTASLDENKLQDKGYSIIVGFASSWQGAYFQGAIGSKLYVDNVKIFCE